MDENIDSRGVERELSEVETTELSDYKPKTPLGRRLWEIRSQLVASGERLLRWEEIELEVAERRGRDEERGK